MTKHTPTPIEVDEDDEENGLPFIPINGVFLDKGVKHKIMIAQVCCDFTTDERDKPYISDRARKDAAFIALAYNNHDLIIFELMQARQTLQELQDKHLGHTAAVVRAILQKRLESIDATLKNAGVKS